jgi:hypothetical protein
MMTLAYMPDVWDCFGITQIDQWKNVAPRFLFYAVDWILNGYSQHTKIMAIRQNVEGNEDMFAEEGDTAKGDEFRYSTGFVTGMGVNMGDTAKACGIPLSLDYIENNYGFDPVADGPRHQNEVEIASHILNHGWKANVKTNAPFVINFTDFSGEQAISFIKDCRKLQKEKKKNFALKFYGVYSIDSDAPYEISKGTDEEREAELIAAGHKPVLVFAVNKGK